MSNTKQIIAKNISIYQNSAYKQSHNKLQNTAINLIESFAEDIIDFFHRQLNVMMDSNVIIRNYVEDFSSRLLETLSKSFSANTKEIFDYEMRSASDIDSLSTKSAREQQEEIAILTSGITRRSVSPSVQALDNLRDEYIKNFRRALERFSSLGVDVDYHLGDLQDLINTLFIQIKNAYQNEIIDLSTDLETQYEKTVNETIKPAENVTLNNPETPKQATSSPIKKNKPKYEAANFPQELMLNLKRMLALKGYTLVTKNNQFYAAKNGVEEEINFLGGYHYFDIGSRYPHEYFELDLIWIYDKGKKSPVSDYYHSDNGFFRHNNENNDLSIELGNDWYKISVTNGQVKVLKNSNNVKTTIPLATAKAELESAYPGLIDAYLQLYNITKTPEQIQLEEEIASLEKQQSEIQQLINQKKAQLQALNPDTALADFKKASELQKKEDLLAITPEPKMAPTGPTM